MWTGKSLKDQQTTGRVSTNAATQTAYRDAKLSCVPMTENTSEVKATIAPTPSEWV